MQALACLGDKRSAMPRFWRIPHHGGVRRLSHPAAPCAILPCPSPSTLVGLRCWDLRWTAVHGSASFLAGWFLLHGVPKREVAFLLSLVSHPLLDVVVTVDGHT